MGRGEDGGVEAGAGDAGEGEDRGGIITFVGAGEEFVGEA